MYSVLMCVYKSAGLLLKFEGNVPIVMIPTWGSQLSFNSVIVWACVKVFHKGELSPAILYILGWLNSSSISSLKQREREAAMVRGLLESTAGWRRWLCGRQLFGFEGSRSNKRQLGELRLLRTRKRGTKKVRGRWKSSCC